ncbi:hypothetical protein PVAP13_6KG192936 [Panicum virgatum]|uniref:Uncharacterized protein n=1 Tax=Panicum virgatum TaxID=38727 RepID=A0A8T0RCP3_PANVG|nr:hypothetical protein PVAP13_6KG192936 [Panicum virgatum]
MKVACTACGRRCGRSSYRSSTWPRHAWRTQCDTTRLRAGSRPSTAASTSSGKVAMDAGQVHTRRWRQRLLRRARNIDGFNLPVDIEPAAGDGVRSSGRRAQRTSTGCARARWRRGMAAARWWVARARAWSSARMSTAAAGGSRRRQHAGRAGTGGCSRRSAHRPTATPTTGAAPSPATTA